MALHPVVRHGIANKIRGAIVGSALGDCIGLYTEFLNKQMSSDAYPEGKFTLTGEVTRFKNDSHRNKFSEGSWTDDTDHCLLIILSFLHTNGKELSALDFAARLRIWVEQGLRCLDRLPLGIGRFVGSVVTKRDYLDDPKLAAYKSWATTSFSSAPNGSLMRTYPLGIMCWEKSLEETFDIAAEFSRVTHYDPRCVVSCCIGTAIVRGIINGQVEKEEDLDAIVDAAAIFVEQETVSQKSHSSKITESQAGSERDVCGGPPSAFDREELYRHTKAISYAALELDDLQKLGYVYKCLGSSIFCLRLAMRHCRLAFTAQATILPSKDIFEDLITELTLEGGDADTNGVVAGAFLGCFLGFSLLPRHWYEGVQHIEWLLRKADALVQVLGIDQCAIGYVGSEDPDTNNDGGKGLLDRQQLEAREMAFMEVYLRKSTEGKGKSASRSGSTFQRLLRKWKTVFG